MSRFKKRDREWYEGILLGLAREESDETLESLAESLLAAGWGDRYSLKYLASRRLPELVDQLRESPDIELSRRLFDELEAEYEAFAEVQVVWFPVVNLSVPEEGLEVGDTFSLRMIDGALLDDFERRLLTVLPHTLNAPEDQEHVVEITRDAFKRLQGKAGVASVRVVCRSEIAIETARPRVAELLDFLNAAGTLLYKQDLNVRVGALGEVASESEVLFVYSEVPNSFALPMRRVGPLGQLELTASAVKRLQELGLWEFTDVLGKTHASRTEFESALVLALHWYANYKAQHLPTNQLLSLIIAAETLFPPKRQNIGFSCAEAMAFVLKDDAESRRGVREFFQAMYGKRGNIAHRGQHQVTERDVYQLANLVMGVFLRLLRRRDEFTTLKGVENWVDVQRLA